ncbi:MAG: S-adenosylmethionine:tRNA ribosyltransferase-isomerase, partial [Phycisphaeraceae bacterium]|nr:S-adenosylmethionine:tRNA ribosyltransferase-isomerase [Phycisphaeraceae bacterium]
MPDTRLSTLDYELPVDRIATQAAEPRDAARLMVVHRDSGGVEHRHVRDLADIVARDDMPAPSPGDLMIFNQTRVLPAQFEAVRAATGGKITGLYLRHAPPNQWQVMLESRGTLREGEKVELDADSHLILTQRLDGGQWRATLQSPTHTLELLERIGETPLPPYIRSQRRNRNQREVGDDDAARYNTVYARAPGSVAAPTAGL